MVRLCIDKTEGGTTLFKASEFIELAKMPGSIPFAVLESYREGADLLWASHIVQYYNKCLGAAKDGLIGARDAEADVARSSESPHQSRFDTTLDQASAVANALDAAASMMDGMLAFDRERTQGVDLGSLVRLSFEGENADMDGWYLVAIYPLVVNFEGVKVSAISSNSPIAKCLKGSKVGELFNYKILDEMISGTVEEII